MAKLSIKVGAILMALAPSVAMAQSALSDPGTPGSGYQIPEVPRNTSQAPAAGTVDLSKPGDGYRITPVERTDLAPLAAEVQYPGVPGDGYRIPVPSPRPEPDRN